MEVERKIGYGSCLQGAHILTRDAYNQLKQNDALHEAGTWTRRKSLCPYGVIRKGFRKAAERTLSDSDSDDPGSYC